MDTSDTPMPPMPNYDDLAKMVEDPLWPTGYAGVTEIFPGTFQARHAPTMRAFGTHSSAKKAAAVIGKYLAVGNFPGYQEVLAKMVEDPLSPTGYAGVTEVAPGKFEYYHAPTMERSRLYPTAKKAAAAYARYVNCFAGRRAAATPAAASSSNTAMPASGLSPMGGAPAMDGACLTELVPIARSRGNMPWKRNRLSPFKTELDTHPSEPPDATHDGGPPPAKKTRA